MQNGLAGATALAERLQGQPGVRAVLPRVHFSGLISNGDKSTVFVGSGVVPEVDFRVRGMQTGFVAGEPFAAGADVPEIAIGPPKLLPRVELGSCKVRVGKVGAPLFRSNS